MKNNAKIVIALICFAVAGAVIAYQLGIFDSGPKKATTSGTATNTTGGQTGGGNVPEGSVGVGNDVFQKPTG